MVKFMIQWAKGPLAKRMATALCLACWCFISQVASAQGVTGTTVTLDGSNCTVLYSQGAQSSSQAYFSYLRHNDIPIQITNANYYGLTDTGTGLFKAMVNNMGITDGNIVLYNNAGNYNVLYFAIIAPTGYNIARYVLDINSSVVRNNAAGNTAGATVEEYTYTANNSGGQPIATDNVLQLTGSKSDVLDVTKSSGVNKLYFKIQFKDKQAYQVNFNSLKVTFAIDQPFEVSVPNDEGSVDVHTGLIDLGEFSQNAKRVWTFTDTNVNDLQQVALFGEDDEGGDIPLGTVALDGSNYAWTLKNGTFYLEAPKNYRVVGGSLEFLSREMAVEEKTEYNKVTSASSLVSGGEYVIGNGSAYLQIYTSYNGTYSVTTVSSVENATKWTVTSDGNGKYYIYSKSHQRYLYANSSLALSTTTAAGSYGSTAAWTYDSNGYLSMEYEGRWSTNIYYLSSSLGCTTSTGKKITHPFTRYIYTPAATSAPSTYTATVYGADGETVASTAEVSPTNSNVTLKADGLNNDAVKFSVSGLDGSEVGIFRVSITVQMLDPYVNVIKTAYQEKGEAVVSEVSSSSSNMAFNAGETIVVPIPGKIASEKGADYKYPIVFRDAYNENRTADYDGTASGNGLSNYYLVGSPFDQTGDGSKVDVDVAGTKTLNFTNIKDVKAGTASRIQDNDFDASQAGFQEIRLKNQETKTVYIYSADRPVYLILPENRREVEHVAYAYYSAKVMPFVVEEVPDLEVADIEDYVVYKQTLKGANNKNSAIAKDSKTDTEHYFFGIKVKAKKEDPNNTSAVRGVLTSDQIITAVKNLLVANFPDRLYGVDDPFRTILYLDMSALTTVSDADGQWQDFFGKTADNCLYFMPEVSNVNATNVVAGGENGEATGDIVIYDQQPFFTPYTFKTGTHQVTYQRTGTNDKAPTQNTTLMMPFDIPLSADGYLKSYSDVVDEGVRFYKMDGVGAEDTDANVDTKVYHFNAVAVNSGKAEANKPYHIVSAVTDEQKSYVIQLTGATFRPLDDTSGVVSETNGSISGTGNYCGVEVDKGGSIYYFSKEYFWNSSTLTVSNTVKVLPYRVYYKASGVASNQSQMGVSFYDTKEEADATGILQQRASGLRIVSGDGSVAVLSDADIDLSVYDLAGRRVAVVHVQGGCPQRITLSRGVYMANGVKVLVK